MVVGSVVLCGLVLLVSAVSKVRSGADYAEFVASVPAFGVPARWTRLFAAVTVVAEFVIAGLLLPAAVLVPVGFGAGRWLAGLGGGVVRCADRRGVACGGPRVWCGVPLFRAGTDRARSSACGA
jgi:hypothetical protein